MCRGGGDVFEASSFVLWEFEKIASADAVKTNMPKISIACPQEAVPIDRGRVKDIVRAVLAEENVADYEISLAFVDNETIHVLNKRYLNHDEPTDILTFPLSDPSARKLQGELVIGAEVAQEYAADRGIDVQLELSLYVIHGLLHLCGFDDKDPKDERRMRERERHHLKALGLPDVADQ